MSEGEQETHKEAIEAKSELRLEVGSQPIHLQLKDGHAEVFGSEIAKDGQVTLVNTNAAVFTWQGATVCYTGEPINAYKSSTTPMNVYLNVHAALEQLRADSDSGPRVLIAGPADVGKSTLAKILCNYAARQHRQPLFVDLGVSENMTLVPGVLSASPIIRPADIADPSMFLSPIAMHYGHLSPKENKRLFAMQMANLSQAAEDKLKQDAKIRKAGVIIDTQGLDEEQIITAVRLFAVNEVLVLDHERLLNVIRSRIQKHALNVNVTMLPKSQGVVMRDAEMRAEDRQRRIRQYFYGTTQKPGLPQQFPIDMASYRIYKVGAPAVPAHCLPIGATPNAHETQLVAIDKPTSELNHAILSVSTAPEDTPEDQIVRYNVAGFVNVQRIEAERGRLHVLSPMRAPLPYKILLLHSASFEDTM